MIPPEILKFCAERARGQKKEKQGLCGPFFAPPDLCTCKVLLLIIVYMIASREIFALNIFNIHTPFRGNFYIFPLVLRVQSSDKSYAMRFL